MFINFSFKLSNSVNRLSVFVESNCQLLIRIALLLHVLNATVRGSSCITSNFRVIGEYCPGGEAEQSVRCVV
jgi:hypothetical protein